MRRTPLTRRTPLVTKTPLTPGEPPKRTKRIAPMSARRCEDIGTRRDVVMVVKARDQTCQAEGLVFDVACGGGWDVHEPLPRSADRDSWLDADQCVLLCRFHHDYLHNHPLEAEALGFKKRRRPA